MNPALEWLSSLDEQLWEKVFNGSPVRRAGFLGMRRNVAIAMGNAGDADSGERSFVPRLKEWAGSADEGLRTAARWALSKLDCSTGLIARRVREARSFWESVFRSRARTHCCRSLQML